MNILFHTWEPGLISDVPNSAGGSLWIRHLWAKLKEDGHVVSWAGDGEPDGVIAKSAWEDMSDFVSQAHLVVLFWRWKMHEQYEDRNRAYLRQRLLIEAAIDANVPVLVHDQDHMITDEETDWLRAAGVTLSTPETHPRPGYVSLLFPNPYASFRPPSESALRLADDGIDLIYVGNNYERWDAFDQYYIKAAGLGLKVAVYGNWMEKGPGRRDPEEVKALAPHIDFRGRIPQAKIVETLAMADMAVHLGKPSYGPVGFITMRWCEAAAAGILGLVPGGFVCPTAYEDAAVESGEDIFWLHMNLSLREYVGMVAAQQDWVRTNMKAENWITLFKELAK